MSSVNNNDEVKKLRDYYEKREEELNAQHAKEKKRLVETQKANLEKVSTDSNALAKQTRENTTATISKSDMRHANDIERMKAMHSKQLRDQIEKQRADEGQVRESYKKELEREAQMNKKQIGEKEEAHSRVLRQHQQDLEGTIQGYSQAHTEKMGTLKQNLKTEHENIEKMRDKQRASEREQEHAQFSEFKENKQRETARLKNIQQLEKDRLQSQHEKAVRIKEADNQNVVEDMRELHLDGVDRERRQYNKALKEERKIMLQAQEDMRRGVGEQKIKELNDKIAELEKQNFRQKQKAERAKNREVENVKMAYEDNIELLQNQKTAIAASHGKSKSEAIAEIEKKSNEQVKTAHDYFQSRLEEEAEHNDRNVTRMQKRLTQHNANKTALQDARFKKFQDQISRDQVENAKKQQQSLALLKTEHEDSVSHERRDQEQQRKVMQASYEDRVAKLQMKQNQEMEDLKKNYDGMMAQMRSEFENQNFEANKKLREAEKEKTHASEMELKAKEAQFEYRLKRMEEAYNENLRRLSRKHDESVQMLTTNNKDGRGRYV